MIDYNSRQKWTNRFHPRWPIFYGSADRLPCCGDPATHQLVAQSGVPIQAIFGAFSPLKHLVSPSAPHKEWWCRRSTYYRSQTPFLARLKNDRRALRCSKDHVEFCTSTGCPMIAAVSRMKTPGVVQNKYNLERGFFLKKWALAVLSTTSRF